MEEEKMLVITHHTGEPHSILGAQVAATYMTHTWIFLPLWSE